MTYVATRLAAVKPSASMAASMAAKALRATGVDVIDLGLGEPDFPTPTHVAECGSPPKLAGIDNRVCSKSVFLRQQLMAGLNGYSQAA